MIVKVDEFLAILDKDTQEQMLKHVNQVTMALVEKNRALGKIDEAVATHMERILTTGFQVITPPGFSRSVKEYGPMAKLVMEFGMKLLKDQGFMSNLCTEIRKDVVGSLRETMATVAQEEVNNVIKRVASGDYREVIRAAIQESLSITVDHIKDNLSKI